MNAVRTIVAACCVTSIAASACAPQLHATAQSDAPEQITARLDHGYGLLNDLLVNESKVSEILAIKSVSDSTAALLKEISATASKSLETLHERQSSDPALDLTSTGLPMVEIDARNRISKSQTTGLLLSFSSFELRILLTQRAACEYAWALASSLAALDPNAERAEAISKIATEFDELLTRVVKQLSVASPPAT